jgi:L-lactate dehydrogenase complex protein LldF
MPTHNSHNFAANARLALRDRALQEALRQASGGFQQKRAKAIAALPEFFALKAHLKHVKQHCLDNLDEALLCFEAQAQKSGSRVFWASDAKAANEIIVALCQAKGGRHIVKAKSMLAEEIGLQSALKAAGLTPVETDLGEYILQLRQESPSHIVAPALHLRQNDIAASFRRHHKTLPPERALEEASALMKEAKVKLRQDFAKADIAISGANILVAENGAVILATNEGNADLGLSLARHHIVVAGIEKLVPRMEDAFTLLRLLARSATGQELTAYTSLLCGPKEPNQPSTPENSPTLEIILVDNGRSSLLAGAFKSVLSCIRCGACMNHCPVYRQVGGHAYGWVYPGPIGAVINPAHLGISAAGDLADASSLCGHCAEVCPVDIPLPDLLRQWRITRHQHQIAKGYERQFLWLWCKVSQSIRLYRWLTIIGSWVVAKLVGKKSRPLFLPLAGNWLKGRNFIAPQGKTFQQLWRQQGKIPQPLPPTSLYKGKGKN